MTKADIVKAIAAETGMDRNSVQTIVEGMMEEIKRSLERGENVYLRGFGTFEIKTRASKPARDISRNQTIIIPEHKVATFKPSPDMKIGE